MVHLSESCVLFASVWVWIVSRQETQCLILILADVCPITLQVVPWTIYGKFCCHRWSPGPSMAATDGLLCCKWSPQFFSLYSTNGITYCTIDGLGGPSMAGTLDQGDHLWQEKLPQMVWGKQFWVAQQCPFAVILPACSQLIQQCPSNGRSLSHHLSQLSFFLRFWSFGDSCK